MYSFAPSLLAVTLLLFATACSDPCEKAVKKAEACLKKQKGKAGKTEAPRFIQLCKMNTARFKKCLDLKDCAAYQKCISNAGTDPEALKAYQKSAKKRETEVPAEASPTKPTQDATPPAKPAPEKPTKPATPPTQPAPMQ